MQSTFFVSGFVVLACAWAGFAGLAERAFWAHMTMHMAVVAVAAPLIALGAAGRKLDPVRKWPHLFAPIPLSIAELVVVWAWHAPVLHHTARHSSIGFVIEQGLFLLAGLLVWISAFGGGARGSRERAGTGVVALLLTSMHMTLLGALLALTPRPLYAHNQGFESLTALADQQLGGAIMILVGGASYLLGGLWLSTRLLRERARTAEVAE
jgi:putative membrane protein